MRPLSVVLLALAAFPAAHAQQTLLATPETVVWGNYNALAKPALTVKSGDTVTIQTLSTCGSSQRLQDIGIPLTEIPGYVQQIYDKFPNDQKGPGGHILTGPVAIAGAEPGDVLEVRIQKIALDVPWACNSFGAGRGFLPNDFPYSHTRVIRLDRDRMIGQFAPASKFRSTPSSAPWVSPRPPPAEPTPPRPG